MTGTATVEQRPGYSHPTFAAGRRASATALAGRRRRDRPARRATCARSSAGATTQSPVQSRHRSRCASPARRSSRSSTPLALARQPERRRRSCRDTAIADPAGQRPTSTSPDNSDGKFLGPITMREALVHSRNPVAVQLAHAASGWTRSPRSRSAPGSRRRSRRARRAPSAPRSCGRSTRGGVHGVRNLGAAVEPRFVTRVEDRAGQAVWQRRRRRRRARRSTRASRSSCAT